MSPIKLFSYKSFLIFGSFAIISLTSCDIDYAGFAQNKPNNSAIMPADIWVSDALHQIESLDTTSASYTVFKDFGQKIGTSKLYFYEDHSLGKMSFSIDSTDIDEMYFENGKLIFSLHNRSKSTSPYIVAYANNKPYAAAVQDNGEQWKATNPNYLNLDLAFINEASLLAVQTESKEKNPDYVYRISQLNDTITRQLAPSLNEYFVMNVMEGDPIQFYLESESEDMFFTIGPKDGVNMERRNWKGDATKTGDLLITVFSTNAIAHNYTLIAKRLINESQFSLQSIR